jgi:hypothetical protein
MKIDIPVAQQRPLKNLLVQETENKIGLQPGQAFFIHVFILVLDQSLYIQNLSRKQNR